ncbi:MAG: glycosyl hydrolase-related protein [Bifidobacteriaceae bacterium]|nr:glycosyl hydrolase-related protein [Bifidobacteriaceae bacterium]MCI1914988.1 glycosyl hydrolase-related protein [Bifidobacteriaceae bacterium]
MFLKIDQQISRAERVLSQRIGPHLYRPLSECALAAFANPGEPELSGEFLAKVRRGEANFTPFHAGQTWGTTWGTVWFAVQGSIPPQTADRAQTRIELVADLGWYDHSVGGHVEGMVFREDGSALKALHPRNRWVLLRDSNGETDPAVRPDGSFTLYIEAACNPLILPSLPLPPGPLEFKKTELGDHATGKPEEPYVLRSMGVYELDEELVAYSHDLDIVVSLLRELDDSSLRYWQLAKALQRSLNLYDERARNETLAGARDALADVLSRPAVPTTLNHVAIGHAHIDSAWLWPVRETRRKVARTVSNVLELMKEYPDLKYAMSSAQQYEWLEQDYPDLFAAVQARVAEGRFIPVGGQWVEADGMIPRGESLIRQISFGKHFFMDKFGVEPRGIWLPDSFGYTGAYPQIARRAGYEWFLTQKISWNDTTKFPHHSFMWEGVDGSRIFTHFPPSDSYAAQITPNELRYSERNFQDKDLSSTALMLFGYGDGGGGPTREMMERLHRVHSLEGVPRVEIGTPDDFFEKAHGEMAMRAGDEGMPVWKGELYLELHRGTLTSQQDMKRGCRQEEAMLRTVEYLCAAASVLGADFTVPQERIDRIWKTLLLNQFHDILPGSALAWVHRQAREEYQRDIASLREIAHDACEAIARVNVTAASTAASNDAASDRQVVPEASIVPFSCEPGGSWAVRATSAAVVAATDDKGAPAAGTLEHGAVLDNGLLRATFAADGSVTSLYDLVAQRELVAAGTRLGTYELLRDEPSAWDAWEIERDAFLQAHEIEDGKLVNATVLAERGGGSCVSTLKCSDADITTTATLAPGARHLDFAVSVDWHTQEKFLKVDFPLAIQAEGNAAQYECQYGIVERPVAKNTRSDEAKFESCTHRFVRLREAGYGLSVVNGSTYGSDVSQIAADAARGRTAGTLVRLSLLSAPQFPDPRTDQGHHDFTWSVVAGEDFDATLDEAAQLNSPVLSNVPLMDPLVLLAETSGSGTAVIDWIKLADDGSGDVIARLYEAAGGRVHGRVKLCSALDGADVQEADVLERTGQLYGEPAALIEGTAEIDLGPFQLATLRIHRG